MAAKDRSPADVTEHCAQCEQTAPHEVSVKILTENSHSENPEFSREPYRVAVCQVCGEQTELRMNNA